MTAIRPLAPANCPNCGAPESLFIDGDRIKCRLCGHVEAWPPEAEPVPQPASQRKLKPSYGINYKGALDPWARAAFDTGQDCIRREDWDGAIDAFRRAIGVQSDFTDAHLWLARLADDPAVKRDHLTTVLAQEPYNSDALRELMVLDGKLTPEEAERAYHHGEAQVVRADLPVGMQTTVLRCPVCGGDLTTGEQGEVTCKSCGYTDERAVQRTVSEGSLAMALLKRKANPVRWVIGERLLHCDNCGAERTIAATKLTTRCPFCGSNHVVERDALASFQQPDGLVRFAVTKQQAGEAIKAELGSWGERIKGLFDNRMVKRGTLEDFYLPFWIFDAIVEVTRTTIDHSPTDQYGAPVQPYTTVTIPELSDDVPVCAVSSPPPELIARIGEYDLDAMVAYEPKLLAKHPAELYTLDFDRAALSAHGVISRAMREKHGKTGGDNVQVNIFTSVREMSFQLALLPVWVGTLVEEDGDLRVALVNGQSGRVALGESRKSS